VMMVVVVVVVVEEKVVRGDERHCIWCRSCRRIGGDRLRVSVKLFNVGVLHFLGCVYGCLICSGYSWIDMGVGSR
jgi:hypothetical protein